MSDAMIQSVGGAGGLLRTPAAGLAPGTLTDGFVRALEAETGGRDGDEARRASEQLVALTFVQPVLREAREASRAAPPFAPTAIEKQFGPLMDQILSERIVRSSNWAIVERIAHDMERQGTAPEASQAGRTERGHG